MDSTPEIVTVVPDRIKNVAVGQVLPAMGIIPLVPTYVCVYLQNLLFIVPPFPSLSWTICKRPV
jgi:hypothetical protein